jgi:hypothetical protein
MTGRKLSILALGVIALALTVTAVNAQGAKEYAPGQQQTTPGSAKEYAPGQMKGPGESAREYAPGQQNKDEQTTGRSSTGKPLKEKPAQ